MSEEGKQLSDVERIKSASNLLRGTLAESLADPVTGAIAEDDTQLSKFHGLYQQDDRDLRAERARQKLEPAYSFMIRVRVPGGICTPAQWLAMDELGRAYGGDAIRITTRQALQFHGIIKRELKPTMQGINAALMDTIAACGDVNRNVMCTPMPEASTLHGLALPYAQRISDHLTPRTNAYAEIWLDGEKVSTTPESEPIYGPTYLPRKFKIALAIPPHNDVDVFAHDLSFIAIGDGDELAGFNVLVGGGMGATHGDPSTFPRVGDPLGFCTPAQAVAVAEHVVTTQRDYGDRTNRKQARLKYTIHKRGVDWFRGEVEERCGFQLEAMRPHRFTHTGDRFGWQRGTDDLWHLGLFIPSGRVKDHGMNRFLAGMRALAELGLGEFRLTPNQNAILGRIPAARRAEVDAVVSAHGLDLWRTLSPTRLNSMACVALPTCSLAMAEAERYLPELVDKVETLLVAHGLQDDGVKIRMTGCPNGCARPYLAEIGLVGKAPGRYNLRLGGDRLGTRLNQPAHENVDEARALEILDGAFAEFRARRVGGESFGDFVHRTQTAGGG